MTNRNNLIRRIVDISMTIILLCLMSFQMTGEALHEWVGIGMTAVLIIHHILNRKWYPALFKGKYNAYRIITTVINMLLLLSIALTSFCGMSMSSTAVPFLYGMADMVFARTTHLALSYWSYILMGLHIGLHLPAPKTSILVTVLSALIAGIGLWLFIRNGIPSYLIFRTHFAFFDDGKHAFLVFAENLAELFFFIFIGAVTVRILRNLNKKAQPPKP